MTEVLIRSDFPRTSARSVERAKRGTAAVAAPAWRGVSHEKAFALSPALGLLLVVTASGRAAQLAAAVFALTMTAALGASALNHRATLGLRWELRFRRADHTAINLFIAGTWTSVALVVLSGTSRLVLTAVVWGAALAASVVTIAWLRVPGWLMAVAGVAAAWPAAWLLSAASSSLPSKGVALFLAGGLVYTVGAVAYASQRPNPHPAFGYHEVFHALVLVGAACHYATLAFFVLPLAD